MASDLQARLPVRAGGDELDQIAIIMNSVLGRPEELVGALRAAGENIAHDLCSPLTWVRARLERVRNGPIKDQRVLPLLDQSIEGIDQTVSIITALLRIAEIDHVPRYAGFDRFDMAEIVRETAETYQPIAEEKQVVLCAEVPGPVPVRGDRDLLVEALVNLVDNAVKFTPPGGSVCVSLRAAAGRCAARLHCGAALLEKRRRICRDECPCSWTAREHGGLCRAPGQATCPLRLVPSSRRRLRRQIRTYQVEQRLLCLGKRSGAEPMVGGFLPPQPIFLTAQKVCDRRCSGELGSHFC